MAVWGQCTTRRLYDHKRELADFAAKKLVSIKELSQIGFAGFGDQYASVLKGHTIWTAIPIHNPQLIRCHWGTKIIRDELLVIEDLSSEIPNSAAVLLAISLEIARLIPPSREVRDKERCLWHVGRPMIVPSSLVPCRSGQLGRHGHHASHRCYGTHLSPTEPVTEKAHHDVRICAPAENNENEK